jgi:hypothetical protein
MGTQKLIRFQNITEQLTKGLKNISRKGAKTPSTDQFGMLEQEAKRERRLADGSVSSVVSGSKNLIERFQALYIMENVAP